MCGLSSSSEGVRSNELPGAVSIPPAGEAGDRHGPGPEASHQIIMERSRFGRRNLVLHRDVRSPASGILRYEVVPKGVRQLGANVLEVRRMDPYGHAPPEIQDARRHSAGAPSPGRVDQSSIELPFDRWRKMMEQGEVGRQDVPLGREMRLPQAVKPSEGVTAEHGRDDDGIVHGGATRSRCAIARWPARPAAAAMRPRPFRQGQGVRHGWPCPRGRSRRASKSGRPAANAPQARSCRRLPPSRPQERDNAIRRDLAIMPRPVRRRNRP